MVSSKQSHLKKIVEILNDETKRYRSAYMYVLTDDGEIIKRWHGSNKSVVWATKAEVEDAKNVRAYQ